MIKHLKDQMFVIATSAAAVVHSTWSLGTFFSGEQPESLPHLLGWLSPAFLVAFALDVGQIQTAAQIRKYGLTPARALTFLIMSGFTYFLQWLYLIHHYPDLVVSAGIAPEHIGFVLLVKSYAIWIIPALLPVSIIMYTFSAQKESEEKTPQNTPKKGRTTINDAPTVTAPVAPSLPPVETPVTLSPALSDVLAAAGVDEDTQEVEALHVVTCEHCGEWSKEYETAENAQRGLKMHYRHCAAVNAQAPAQVGLSGE